MKQGMNRSLVAALLLCALMVGCANPYLAQMDAVEADYQAGRISESEYNRKMDSLQARSDALSSQNSANAQIGSSLIGAAGIVGGSLIQAEAVEDHAHAVGGHNGSGGSKGKPNGKTKSSGSKSKSKEGGTPGKKGWSPDEPPGADGIKTAPSRPRSGSTSNPFRVPDPKELD